jgi:putative acetyltransferase
VNSTIIRNLSPKDGEAAAHIFFDAVHNGTADVYSDIERDAWAGTVPDIAGWIERFETIRGFAADIENQMVGFMTLDAEGYIDFAFVRSDVAGLGIGRLLYTALETNAIEHKIKVLTTTASKKAKPFFERFNWKVEQEQSVKKWNIALTNFKMSKILVKAADD